MKRIVTLVLAALMLAGCAGKTQAIGAAAEEGKTMASESLYVEKVEGLGDDFILGADVSVLLAEESSGVVYRSFDGQEQDMLKTLAEAGVNYVRVRVWVDPFDEQGRGYGGGNCTADTAAKIGRRAARYGMKLLVDFHYSDFWADPGKQRAPKAWENLSVAEKAARIKEYTAESLKAIRDAGADIGMVQVGNETTNGLCGENDYEKMCVLFQAGAEAVRAFDPNILIAIHFTDPQNGNYAWFAKMLQDGGVDYDVFASSYYPFWHGTLANLKDQLSQVARTYGKKVMVAETQWPYTTTDGDGTGNTAGGEVSDGPYPFTVQGQSRSIRDIAATVAAIDGGIGVFYWEAGWIPVPGNDWAARSALWEKYGSGWAASYAGGYDADAGLYYGGSACDNMALFDYAGNPLESLKTFGLLKTGNAAPVVTDALEWVAAEVGVGQQLDLPETVPAILTDGSRKDVPVTWDAADAGKVDTSKPGDYTVRGTAEGLETRCAVKVAAGNYLKNPSFEDEDRSMWTFIALADRPQGDFQKKAADAYTGDVALHFWDSSPVNFQCEQIVTGLPSGSWRVSVRAQGGDVGSDAEIYLYVIADGKTYTAPLKLQGWVNWQHGLIEHIPCTSGTITVGVCVRCQSGGWGTFDDFELNLE